MIIKTQLKYTIGLLIILVLGIPPLLITVISYFDSTFNSEGAGAFICLLLFITWLFIIVELRDKAVIISLSDKDLKIRRYLGFGKEEYYDLKNLTGFQTCQVSGYNYLYFINEKVRIAKSSNFYHSNFNEVLQFSKKYLTDLGKVYITIPSEIKDALQKQQTN